MQKRGLFVSFEGGDKTGKTTAINEIHNRLQNNYRVIKTKEPGGDHEIGEEIRNLIFNKDIGSASELLLFFADRAENYRKIIKPALKEGSIVLSDRYIDSSIVYQGYLKGWHIANILKLHKIATGALFPDLTFVLDSSDQNYSHDKFEKLNQDKVKAHYLHLSSKFKRMRYINRDLFDNNEDYYNSIVEEIRKKAPEVAKK